MNRQAVLRSIVYLALFLSFTLLFILLNYPSERLTDQVNGFLFAATEGAVSVDNVRFRPPLSLEAGEVTVVVGQGSVDMGRAVVGMRLFSFLSGNKGADVRLENPWLDSSLTVVSSGEGWDLDAPKIEIDLSELPEDIMPFSMQLKGKVDLSLNLLSTDSSMGVSSAEVKITSGPIEMSGDLLETLGLAPFPISSVMAVATVKDNVLTLGENALEGGLAGSARGDIKIAPANFMASRLNLTVELTPGPEYRERLTPLFALMGARAKANGSVSFKIRGTIEKPAVTM
ncbi:MAG: type II secretion system protein GspN [bacterium]|nr:type II secretion system protein GspN [bacterium]MDT8365058.1 type II secretion system protein GspN [bacterium]